MKSSDNNAPHILEFSGQEGKRASLFAWLASGLLTVFVIGLSRQRRREQADARRHAPKHDTETEPPYGGADVAFGVIIVMISIVMIAMFILLAREAQEVLPIIVDDLVRRST